MNSRVRLTCLTSIVWLATACTGWTTHQSRALPVDSPIATLRVVLRDGTQQSLTNALVTTDSVIGMGSVKMVRVAHARGDVIDMQRRSFDENAQVRVTRRDGSLLLMRSVQSTKDSIIGMVDGLTERVAISRADVRALQRRGFLPGRTLVLVAAPIAAFMLYAIGTMGSFSLAGAP